jgi:hypothetical protein
MMDMSMKTSKYILVLAVVLGSNYVTATAQGVYQAWARMVVGNGYSGYNDSYGLDIYLSPRIAITPGGEVYLAYGISDSVSGMDISIEKIFYRW